MLKSLLTNIAATAAVLFPVGSATAAEHKDPLSQWVKQVNRQIDDRAQKSVRDVAGTAVIAFRRGADGRAYDLNVRGGNAAVAAAGMRTLKHLHDLPPLPTGYPADQQIVMNYLIGAPNGSTDFEEARARLLAKAESANAQVAARVTGTQVALVDR